VIVQDGASHGRIQEATVRVHWLGVDDLLIVVGCHQVNDFTGVTQPDRAQRFHRSGFERQQHFFDVRKSAAFALGAGLPLVR